MTFDAVKQRCIPQFFELSFCESKFNFLPVPFILFTCFLKDLLFQLKDLRGDVHCCKGCIIRHALEEWNRVPRSRSSGGAENTVRSTDTHPTGHCLQPLAYSDYKRPINGRTINPLSLLILHLQSAVRTRL